MYTFKKPRTIAQQLFAALGFLGSQFSADYLRAPRTARKRHPLMITADARTIAIWNRNVDQVKANKRSAKLTKAAAHG